jgi:chaperonin GroES
LIVPGEKAMKIRPLQDRVVVRRKEEETTTAGGIVLPGSAAEKPAQGIVVAVGPGRVMENGDKRPVDLKEGDTVVFGKYASNTVKIDDEELLILSESEIFGVIES